MIHYSFEGVPKSFAAPAVLRHFYSSTFATGPQRSQIKMPLQHSWKGICAQDWIISNDPKIGLTQGLRIPSGCGFFIHPRLQASLAAPK